MIVKRADFITSMKDYGDFATKGCPEVAFAGKSNVGKSSMINKLTNRNKLARTSATPGAEIEFSCPSSSTGTCAASADGAPRSIAAASVSAAARPKGLCIKTPILSSSSLRQFFFCPVFYIIRLFIRIVDMSARFSTKNLLFVENSRFCIIL